MSVGSAGCRGPNFYKISRVLNANLELSLQICEPAWSFFLLPPLWCRFCCCEQLVLALCTKGCSQMQLVLPLPSTHTSALSKTYVQTHTGLTSLDLLYVLGIYTVFSVLKWLQYLFGNFLSLLDSLWTVPGVFLCEEEPVPEADALGSTGAVAVPAPSSWHQCYTVCGESFTKEPLSVPALRSCWILLFKMCLWNTEEEAACSCAWALVAFFYCEPSLLIMRVSNLQ